MKQNMIPLESIYDYSLVMGIFNIVRDITVSLGVTVFNVHTAHCNISRFVFQ